MIPSAPQNGFLSYRAAGVDVPSADKLVARLRVLAATTHGKEVRPYLDAYAGLYELPGGALLAATCDGVGTKLLIAQALRRYRGLGQDLVAMNVNDLLPCAARPLFFLDYLAAGQFDDEALCELTAGMADACRTAGCALLGGETAQMPDVYGKAGFDVAGFAVGLTDSQKLPRRDEMTVGDRVLGLSASGVHANGLSLARRACERAGLGLFDTPSGLARPLGDELLTPTAIYVEPVLAAFAAAAGQIRAAGHITGGGLLGRAAGLLPAGLRLCLDPTTYPRPPIFDLIAAAGPVRPDEMARTFNMGLGFLMVVSKAAAEKLLGLADSPWLAVGEVAAGEGVDLGYAASRGPA